MINQIKFFFSYGATSTQCEITVGLLHLQKIRNSLHVTLLKKLHHCLLRTQQTTVRVTVPCIFVVFGVWHVKLKRLSSVTDKLWHCWVKNSPKCKFRTSTGATSRGVTDLQPFSVTIIQQTYILLPESVQTCTHTKPRLWKRQWPIYPWCKCTVKNCCCCCCSYYFSLILLPLWLLVMVYEDGVGSTTEEKSSVCAS